MLGEGWRSDERRHDATTRIVAHPAHLDSVATVALPATETFWVNVFGVVVLSNEAKPTLWAISLSFEQRLLANVRSTASRLAAALLHEVLPCCVQHGFIPLNERLSNSVGGIEFSDNGFLGHKERNFSVYLKNSKFNGFVIERKRSGNIPSKGGSAGFEP